MSCLSGSLFLNTFINGLSYCESSPRISVKSSEVLKNNNLKKATFESYHGDNNFTRNVINTGKRSTL